MQKMIARLEGIVRAADPRQNIYLNNQRANMLGQLLGTMTNSPGNVSTRLQYASELLNAGRSAEAARAFKSIQEWVEENNVGMTRQTRSEIEMHIGLSYLRSGEQRNCISNYNSQSCLFPISTAGVHKFQDGSRLAMKAFSDHIKTNPNDLAARWLFNVAAMTVGDYPDKVPAELLISPELFKSEYDMPRFPNGAASAGLDVENLAGGCIADDFDGDGLLDVVMSEWSLQGKLRMFHNNGDGTFTERTREAGLAGLMGGLNIMQTDYNNDGFPDILVMRGAWLGSGGRFPPSLLRNNGDGTFEDVTETAGLMAMHPSQTAAWFDFDNDGLLDLFIGNETTTGDVHPCLLYHNSGDGTFVECAKESGLDIKAFVKGVASGDYDNDGRPDLYLSVRERSNFLLHNDGPAPGHSKEHPAWRFSDQTAKAGVGSQTYSFPTWFFDYDNDGYLDIFVSGYAATVGQVAAEVLGLDHGGERARLYHNNHDGTFSDVTKAAGLYKILVAMGSNFGDLDNDGWLDMYLGTGDPSFFTLIPNRTFRNNGGKGFQDVTTATGMGHLQKGHAVAFADFDNDGDQDVFAKIGGAYEADTFHNALFVNPGNTNHWITLKLEGTKCNRAAMGSRIKINVDTGSGIRSIYKTVSTGGSFGASPLRQEIGLGPATAITSVEIYWPVTGKTETFKAVGMDKFYRIKEESGQAEEYFPKRFKLPVDPIEILSNHRHIGPAIAP